MWTILAQRTIARQPGLLAASFTRSRAPLFASSTVTRSFLTTPRVAYPEQKKVKETAQSKAKTAAKKPATKKPVAKKPATKKPAAKPAAKKPQAIKLAPQDLPPKRPLGAYMRFFADMIKQKPKSTSLAETQALAKETGAAWQALSEADKKPYVEAYQKGYQDYLVEHSKYLENVSPSTLSEVNKQRWKAGKPSVRLDAKWRRPSPPYIRFYAERMSTYMEGGKITMPMAELTKQVSAEWRSLPADQKSSYSESYRKDQEEYAKQRALRQASAQT